jgi:hypothetical protein
VSTLEQEIASAAWHSVAAGSTKIDYKFVNDTTVEATVPEIQPGMSFIDVVASGGNARSKAFLVQAR